MQRGAKRLASKSAHRAAKPTSLGLRFDPGRGKANLYLNGYLIGRYWPERGPQQSFILPWGLLKPDDDNQIA